MNRYNCGSQSSVRSGRGPFAKPTDLERIEYLFTRVPANETRKELERHALEHVAPLAAVQPHGSVAAALLRC